MMPHGRMSDRERLSRVVRTVISASRQDLDVSQEELAARLGWSRNQVANALNIDPVAMLQRVLRW